MTSGHRIVAIYALDGRSDIQRLTSTFHSILLERLDWSWNLFSFFKECCGLVITAAIRASALHLSATVFLISIIGFIQRRKGNVSLQVFLSVVECVCQGTWRSHWVHNVRKQSLIRLILAIYKRDTRKDLLIFHFSFLHERFSTSIVTNLVTGP